MQNLSRILAKTRVMIVDDHGFFCDVLADIMRSLGAYNSQKASDGGEAIRNIPSFLPDMIITDLRMKPVDGIGLSRWVRRSEDSPIREIPIIMVTGEADMDAIRDARDVGISEFIAKPVIPKKVLACLQSVLLHPREFIREDNYFGPDRRRQNKLKYKGEMRRACDPIHVHECSEITRKASAGIRSLVFILVQKVSEFDSNSKESVLSLLENITDLKKLAIASDNLPVAKAIRSLGNYVQAMGLNGQVQASLLRQHLECITLLSHVDAIDEDESHFMLQELENSVQQNLQSIRNA